MTNKLALIIMGLALVGMASWNIYAWGDGQYWKGVSDSRTYMVCRKHTAWQDDLEKLRHRKVGSCAELEVILNGDNREAQ